MGVYLDGENKASTARVTTLRTVTADASRAFVSVHLHVRPSDPAWSARRLAGMDTLTRVLMKGYGKIKALFGYDEACCEEECGLCCECCFTRQKSKDAAMMHVVARRAQGPFKEVLPEQEVCAAPAA